MKVLVGCDLFLPLRLYNLPSWVKQEISDRFPSVDLLPVNVPGSSAEWKQIDVYWGNRISSEFSDSCHRLRWIHFGSVGIDRARQPSIAGRRLLVTSSRGTMTAPLAASALAMITGLARGLHHAFSLRHNGYLTRESFDQHFDSIKELEGEEIVIVGLGEVGLRLSHACHALGMIVNGVARIANKVPSHVNKLVTLTQLEDVIESADYVVNLLPLNDETRHVFDRNLFARMKKSAFFINVGRGGTVVEEELVRALASGEIAGAGLDVFEIEPLSPESQLWSLENVIITPHVGGLSNTYWKKQLELFSFNLDHFLKGDYEKMKNIESLEGG